MSEILTKYQSEMNANNIAQKAKLFRKKLFEATENYNSRATLLSKMNTFIKNKFGITAYNQNYKLLLMNKADKKVLIKNQQDNYLNKLDHRLSIDYTTYIDLINTFKNSRNYYDNVCCLLMASYRRPIEIMKVGVFSKSTSTEFPNMIHMTGIAKKKGNGIVTAVDFPLIELNTDEFLRILTNIRTKKDFKDVDNSKVSTQTNARLNTRFNVLSKDQNITADIIRGVGVDIIYKRYCNPNTSEIKFKARMLGHEDLNTVAMHYSKSYVSNYIKYSDISDANNKIDKLVKLVEELMKKIK